MENQEEFNTTVLIPVFASIIVLGLVLYAIFSAAFSPSVDTINPGFHKAEIHHESPTHINRDH